MTKATKPDSTPSKGSGLFGNFRYQLKQALERQEMTPTQYMQSMGYENAGFFYLVMNGQRGVPLDELERWLKPLRLSDAQYGEMYLAAVRDYAPRYVFDIINTAESIIHEMASAITEDRRQRGLPTSAFPRLADRLGRRSR